MGSLHGARRLFPMGLATWRPQTGSGDWRTGLLCVWGPIFVLRAEARGVGWPRGRGAVLGKHASLIIEAVSWVTGMREKPLETFPIKKKKKRMGRKNHFSSSFKGVSRGLSLSVSLSSFSIFSAFKRKKRYPCSCSCL